MKQLARYGVWGVMVLCAFAGSTATAYQPGFFDHGTLFEFTTSNDELSEAQEEQVHHAVAVCTNHIDRGTDNPLWYLFRARYNFVLYEYDGVFSDCDALFEMDPDFLPGRYLRALSSLLNGSYEKSVDDYLFLIDNDYTHPRVYMHLGRSYWELDKNREAIEAINTIESMGNSLDVYGYWVRGNAYADLEYPEKSPNALADWDRALALDPDYLPVYYSRGDYYYFIDDNKDAVREYSLYIDAIEEVDSAYIQRGKAYYFMYENDLALNDFNKIIELVENTEKLYQEALYFRSKLFYQMDRLDEGIADANKLIDLLGETSQNLTLRGRLYFDKGEYEKSIDDLSNSIKQGTEDLDTWEYRGYSFYQLGNLDEALLDFNYVLERDTESDWVYSQRGLVYSDMGKYELAEKDLTQAITLDPEYSDYYLERAMVLYHLGKYWEAMQDFDKVMESEGNPPNTFATLAISLVGFFIVMILVGIVVLVMVIYSKTHKKKGPRPPALPSS